MEKSYMIFQKDQEHLHYEKREEFYTIKEGVLVDRSKKELSINYIKNQEFDKGLHKVILYTNNYEIGRSEFIIK